MDVSMHIQDYKNRDYDIYSYFCICPQCYHENEVFIDEIGKINLCSKCGEEIPLSTCRVY